MNTLTENFKSKIWIPEIVFDNTQSKLESLNDPKAFATIERKGIFIPSKSSELKIAQIFEGGKNPITISRVYDAEYLCTFDMVC